METLEIELDNARDSQSAQPSLETPTSNPPAPAKLTQPPNTGQLTTGQAASLREEDCWAARARTHLKLGQKALEKKNIRCGWTHVHAIQPLLIYSWGPGQLISHALALRAEARRKLDEWRAEQVAALFSPKSIARILDQGDATTTNEEHSESSDATSPVSMKATKVHRWAPVDPLAEQQLRSAVIEAQRTLNGEHDNTYSRIELVKTQLTWLIIALFVVLCLLTVYLSLNNVNLESQLDRVDFLPMFFGVSLFGALGAIISAAYQLSRSVKRKIPDSVLTGIVTLGRPFIGAGAAVFVYVAIAAGAVTVLHSNVAASFMTAFIAGFSERLVIATAK